jgi:predicted component of type VI protein secretion system
VVAAQLLWRDAQGNEGAIDLGGGEALIGRATECAIRTDDAMVSRHHARVAWRGDAFYIEDLGSSNGVFYQEQRVTRHALRHGDAVRCGSLWLRFVDGMAGHAAAVPAAPLVGQASAPSPPLAGQASAPSPVPAARPQTASEPHTAPAGLETGLEPPAAPPQGSPPSAPQPAISDASAAELRQLRRRVEQLQTELRIYRSSGRGGAETAQRMEELEREVATLSEERDQLKSDLETLRETLETESGDAKVRRAGQIQQRANEIVASLNDVLSNLRINIMAAEGEFEQFHSALPRASFELIREALKSSADDMESAREMMRDLRVLASG